MCPAGGKRKKRGGGGDVVGEVGVGLDARATEALANEALPECVNCREGLWAVLNAKSQELAKLRPGKSERGEDLGGSAAAAAAMEGGE